MGDMGEIFEIYGEIKEFRENNRRNTKWKILKYNMMEIY